MSHRPYSLFLPMVLAAACGGPAEDLTESASALANPEPEWRIQVCPVDIQDADAVEPLDGAAPALAPAPAPSPADMCQSPFVTDRPVRYLGPGDVVPPGIRGGFNGNIPRGSVFTRLCSPLRPTMCVYGPMYLGFFPFRDASACVALARENLAIFNYYTTRFWDGYPRRTCEDIAMARTWDHLFPTTFARLVPPRPRVRCSTLDPGGYDYDDLRGDIISSNTLRNLCQLEIDAGFFN